MIYQEAGYQPINTGNIAALMRQSGQLSSDKLRALADIAAQSQTTQGNASAGFAQNLGNIMANAVGQYASYGGGNKSYEPGGKNFSGPMQPGTGPTYRVDPSLAWQAGGAPLTPSLAQQQRQAALQNWAAYFKQPQSAPVTTPSPAVPQSRAEALRLYQQWITGGK
jgi:hypothetical protein